jgi:sialate O-acetylesterase
VADLQLQDGQVLQRSGETAELPWSAPDPVQVTGADAVEVARAEPGDALRIPVGGPYAVLSARRVVARDVFVGDLFVLGGQSNMQGGALLEQLEPAGPAVRLFGMDRQWQEPVEPLHRVWRSPEPVHTRALPDPFPPDFDELVQRSIGTATPHVGAGCAVAFANYYVAATGVPVGLLPAAYGGSSLADWSPDRDDGLYGAMVRTVRAAGGRVAALLWHQGESETDADSTVEAYADTARKLFEAFRRDIGQPDLPVYAAQIGFFPVDRRPGAAGRWTGVRIAQVEPEPLGVQGVVSTADLTTSDPIHLDATSQQRMGRRFARLVLGEAQTITVAEVTRTGRLVDWPEVMEYRTIRIRLDGVTGNLTAPDVPSGFSVRTRDGAVVPSVWRVELDGDSIVVWLAGPPVEGAALYYGWGTGSDTRCNIVDAVDAAVPCFGPIEP